MWLWYLYTRFLNLLYEEGNNFPRKLYHHMLGQTCHWKRYSLQYFHTKLRVGVLCTSLISKDIGNYNIRTWQLIRKAVSALHWKNYVHGKFMCTTHKNLKKCIKMCAKIRLEKTRWVGVRNVRFLAIFG